MSSRHLALALALVSAPLVHAAYDSGTRPTAGALEVLRATPSGVDVGAERQVVFTFNRPVVPLGDMARTAAQVDAKVEPALACEWRWLDTTSLACQLGADTVLKRATRYRFTLGKGLKAEDGTGLERPYVLEFITQRPSVERWIPFAEWRSPGMPVVRVAFGSEVVTKTVQAHMFFKVEGQRVATVFERADAERPRPDQAPDATPEPPPATTRVLLARPAADVGPDQLIELWVEPGILATDGTEPSAEDRALLSTYSLPLPQFLGVRCERADARHYNDQTLIRAGESRDTGELCDPMRQVALVFSTPMLADEIKAKLKFTPDLAGGRTDFDPWAPDEEMYGGYEGGYVARAEAHHRGKEYAVAIPTLVRADEVHRISAAAGTVEDAFGRPIAAPIDFEFRTAPRPPRFVFDHTTSALEKGSDSEVPVVVTNLRALRFDYETVTMEPSARSPLSGPLAPREAVIAASRSKVTELPKVKDVAYYAPLGVRDLLGGRSGIVVGDVRTDPPVESNYNRAGTEFFAQVTPWQVHVKLGHFNSLVWVTDLASGKAVADARVRVLLDDMSRPGDGRELAQATTGKDGVAVLPGSDALDPTRRLQGWGQRHEDRLTVFVDRAADLAVVPLRYDFRSNSYGPYAIWSSERRRDGHTRAWGTTAQGVYRPGDTVQYKLWVRAQDNQTLTAPPREGYTLEIIDPTDEVVETRSGLRLDDFGALAGEYKVATTAPVGWYAFRLKSGAADMTWQAMRVLITDFTPAPFRVSNEVAGDRFQPDDVMATTTHARLHAGGPYRDAQARVTVTLTPMGLEVKDPGARGFAFDTGLGEGDGEYGGYPEAVQLYQGEGVLDAQGDLALAAPLPDNAIRFGRLSIESAVRDDRGKYMAGVTTATWFGRDRFVGLRTDKWMYNAGSPAAVDYLVVDERGMRVAGTAVDVRVERRVTTGARVKGAGNAYLMSYSHSWEDVARCSEAATLEPRRCSFTPAKAGLYRVTASIADSKGRAQESVRQLWVTGPGEVLWEDDNTGAVRLVPERSQYKVGEKARVMVQNPLPGATALVTVERYGILKRWTQRLDGNAPVIELPIDATMVPGVYLSVVIASPRVDRPLEAGQVDLGKPTLRMGYVQLNVDDAAKRLAVRALPAKPEYRPQDEVSVELRVGPGDKGLGEPVQYAVVVLDEAVFDLIQGGDRYFDPHDGIWALDGLDVANYNLLMTLVGRQKFEKKGANPGGDGGLDLSARSDFRFVAYWNPALRAGADGKASIKFKVPDNLTGWRVIAMAANATDRLGVGVGSFRVTRATEIRPVMPNQVTQGDRFDAAFSVMNRTAAPRTVTVKLGVTGPLDATLPATLESSLTLEPFARGIVKLPVATAAAGDLRFTIAASDKVDRDSLLHALAVKPQRVTETATDWGTTFVPRTTVSLKFPKDIRPDVGSAGVTVSSTVLGNIDGAFKYLRDYPYSCWEQRLTKGVAAMHFLRLGAYIGPGVAWPEAAGYPKQLLDDAATYQAPNGGMTYWVASDRYVSPYLSVYTARAFGWMRRGGFEPPPTVERRLDGYVAGLLKRDAVPSFYDAGMTATVRAVALAALADRGKLDKAELERYRPHLPRMALFGKANFLEAAVKAKAPAATAKAAADLILANTVQSAGKVSFNEKLGDSYRQLLATPLRDQCAVLSAFVAYGETAEGAKLVGDLPFKLVRTIVQARGNRDHWENTQENAFCMNALLDYSRVYEKSDPVFAVAAKLDQDALGEARFATFRDPARTLSRPLRADDVGAARTLTLDFTGTGRMYYAARMTYVPVGPIAGAANAGMEVKREYSVERDGKWVLLADPMQLKRGELVRVDLFVSVPTARHMVVVDDPVPGGLEPVNRDLATASGVDADKAKFVAAGGSWWFSRGDWDEYGLSEWAFYHRELRHDAVRYYADYLPAGDYHLSYAAQAIATGAFSVMATKAEEMYDPDVFGRAAPLQLEVGEQ